MISMGVRTVLFVLALIFSGWLRWVFFVGSLVLPYAAVMLANEGKSRRSQTLPPVVTNRPQITAEEAPNDDSTL